MLGINLEDFHHNTTSEKTEPALGVYPTTRDRTRYKPTASSHKFMSLGKEI